MSHVVAPHVCEKKHVLQSKLVSYSDSSSEEEEGLHVDVNFDDPIDLAIK